VIRAVALLAMLALAAVMAGCGSTTGVAKPGSADLGHGKQLFSGACGGCHTLAAAGTKGTIGPNLDDAALGNRVSGMDSTSFESMVREQIAAPDPYGKMPPDLVKGADAQDVAAYVASVAGVKQAAALKQQNGVDTTPQ
jgi:mono/diheme cytochrome c family protein